MPKGRMRRHRASVGGVSALVLLAAAALVAPIAGASTAAAAAAKGTPYKVYFLDTGSAADPSEGLNGIADAVNARGGLAGRPLKIVRCNDKFDPNQATACAQKAVDDKAIALIAASPSCGSQLGAILTDAKLPSIGDQYFCSDSFKEPFVFPFTPGVFAPVAGAAAGVKLFKQPNVLVSTVDVPAGRGYPPLIDAVVKPVGGKVTTTVYIPLTATDLAPYAAQLVGQKGALSEGDTIELGIRLGKQLQQQGFDQPILFNNTTWDAKVIKDNFGNPKNAYIVSPYDFQSAGYKQFDKDLKKYAPNFTLRSGSMQTAWLSANVLAAVAPKLGKDITSAAVWDYFSTTTAIDTFGMTAKPLNFTVPNDALGGLMSRVSNDEVAIYKYKSGKWVEQTKFEDLLP